MRDCNQAADPQACQYMQTQRTQAQETCKGKAGPERQQCMREQAQKVDCSKSRNPEQCEAHKKAVAECKDQTGPAFRQCVQQKTPPVDCSKSANPARCESMQKARAACQDKPQQERRQCMRTQMAPPPSK